MSLVKRIVKLVICVVILVVAVYVNPQSQALAGEGNGTNEKITTLSTFSELVKETSRKQSSARAVTTKTGESDKSYDSFTLKETTTLLSQSDSSLSEGSSSTFRSSKFSLTRTLEMYYTQDAVWYKSTGRLTSKSSSSSSSRSNNYSSSTKTSMNFNIQIYTEEEKVLLYIENLQYSYLYEYKDHENSDRNKKETEDGQELNVLKNYYNCWIDCTSKPYIANTFLTVNNANMATLSEIAFILDQALEGKDYTQSDNVYQLKDSVVKQFFGLSKNTDANFVGTISVDLSRSTMPLLSIEGRLREDLNGSSYSGSGSSYVYLNDCLEFRNINNTVFKNVNMKTIDISDIIDDEED